MLIREATCADAPAIARVHVDSWRTTYRDLLPTDFLAGLSYATREPIWTRALCQGPRPERVYVADSGGQIVGFASAGPERTGDPIYTAELYAIYVLQAHQGQGIGRRLFAAVVEFLAEVGYTALLLWVLDGNPAMQFYEVMGGRRLRDKTEEVGGVACVEVAYGWASLPTGPQPAS